MSMIPASDREINVTFVIAYCLSYNILDAQRKRSQDDGDIARERRKCRIQFSEKVMSHREYTQNVQN